METEQAGDRTTFDDLEGRLAEKKMTRRELVRSAAVVGLSATVLGGTLAACGSASESSSGEAVFTVAFSGDLSDGWSSYDAPFLDGAKYAVSKINAAGGVAGQKLKLLARDNKNDQALAVQTTQELIDEGAQYFLGTTSNNVVSIGRLAAAEHIPSDTGDNTPPNWVAQIGPYAFQYVMSDNLQAAAMAKECYDLGYRTAYLLRSADDPYTANLPRYFQAAFEELGGKVTGEAEYKLGAGDFSAQVTKIQGAASNLDVIYTPMFMPDSPVFFKQLRAAGVTTPIATSDGNDTPDLLTAGDEVLEGIIMTTFGYPTPGSSLAEFYKSYEADTGDKVDTIIVANGYDSVYILKAALEKTGGKGGSSLRNAIANLSGLKLVTTDNFVMDPTTRRAEREVALIKIVDGAFTFVKNLPYPAYVPAPIQA